MNPDISSILDPMLCDEEGLRLFAYDDVSGKPLTRGMTLKGNLTIGVGYNLSANGLPKDMVMNLYYQTRDAAYASAQSIFTEFNAYSPSRQAALTDMIFNMGEAAFLTFTGFIRFVQSQSWSQAIDDLQNTAYARELPHRVADIARLLGQ